MTRISKSRISMEDGRVDRAYLRDYGETLVGGSSGTNTGSTYTVDLENGNTFNLILNANCTFTFSNPFPSGTATSFTLILKQDNTGSRTVTWPSSVIWPGSTEPTLTTTGGEFDVLTFLTTDGGTQWFGAQVGSASESLPISAWAWGSGADGRLGLDSISDASSPTQVGSDTTWSKVSGGRFHTLALKNNGTLWSWGDGSYGKLGLNSTTSVSSPTQIGTDTDWATFEQPYYCNFAIKTDGTLWAWGSDDSGRLGLNTNNVHVSSPTQVGSDTNWDTVSSSYDCVIALRTDGTLWSWGNNRYGSLGTNSGSQDRSSPTQIGSDTDWVKVRAGFYQGMAQKSDGTLWTWGAGYYGSLGNNDNINVSSPVQIGSDTDWADFSLGDWQRGAIRTDGTLWTWGRNVNGALGLNISTSSRRSSPVQVGSDTDWDSIHFGGYTSFALKTDGTLWAWGLGTNGRLGLDSTTSFSSPVQVGSDTNWVNVEAGWQHSTATRNEQ